MLPSGKTIAASNWKSERTFIGKNFNYRPYFQQAMQGKLGRYFALGTTSKKRGYYFAYPKTDGGRIAGAIVVKVDIGRIEAALSNGPETHHGDRPAWDRVHVDKAGLGLRRLEAAGRGRAAIDPGKPSIRRRAHRAA